MMKHSKLWLALCLALCLAICLIACDEKEPPATDPGTDTAASTDAATESMPSTETETETETESESESQTETETQSTTDSETQAPAHTTCVDVNPKDAKCDVCGKDVPCATCVDATPKDAKCDVCGKDVPCTTCVDTTPKDAKCDVCGKDVPCVTCVDLEPMDNKCDVCGKQLGAPITDVAFEDAAKEVITNDTAMTITQTTLTNAIVIVDDEEVPSYREEIATFSSLPNGDFHLNVLSSVIDPTETTLLIPYTKEVMNAHFVNGSFYQYLVNMILEEEDPENPIYSQSGMGLWAPASATTAQMAVTQYSQLIDKEFVASVADFGFVTTYTNENGYTEYVCTAPSEEWIEDELDAGPGTPIEVDPDGIIYILVMDEDGKMLTWEVTLPVAMTIPMGPGMDINVSYVMTLGFEYDYEDPSFTAPVTDEFWFELTEEEFIARSEFAFCQDECVDNGENGVCDSCGEILYCPNGCVDADGDSLCDICWSTIPCEECVDEDEDGFCDVCWEPMPCVQHVDGNDPFDGYCDICTEPIE